MESKYQIVYTMQYFADFNSIAEYYIEKFKNKDLIVNLEKHVLVREKLLMSFPYSFTLFESNKLLKHEYRTFNALNYKVFYYIDEIAKIIYMERILYAGMNFDNIEL
jgi:plasmid stabilization system protein ParE